MVSGIATDTERTGLEKQPGHSLSSRDILACLPVKKVAQTNIDGHSFLITPKNSADYFDLEPLSAHPSSRLLLESTMTSLANGPTSLPPDMTMLYNGLQAFQATPAFTRSDAEKILPLFLAEFLRRQSGVYHPPSNIGSLARANFPQLYKGISHILIACSI
jgi:hypothetical protein